MAPLFSYWRDILCLKEAFMPRHVTTTTGKSGSTAQARKILAGIVAITAAPTVASDGYLLTRNEYIHFLFKTAGTSPVFRIQVWWYSSISMEWHKGEVLTVNDDDVVSMEVQGLNRVALEVTQIAGAATPTLEAWLALVIPS